MKKSDNFLNLQSSISVLPLSKETIGIGFTFFKKKYGFSNNAIGELEKVKGESQSRSNFRNKQGRTAA